MIWAQTLDIWLLPASASKQIHSEQDGPLVFKTPLS